MEIIRKQLIEEEKLRILLRRALIVEKKKEKRAALNEENMLRKLVRKVILSEAADTAVPHRSTGINVLEDLLKKIIPQLETEYRKLTTSEEQRESFRAHVVSAVQNSLAPTRATEEADEVQDDKFIDVGLEEVNLMEVNLEEIDLEVGDDDEANDEEFIDIETDGADPAIEEPSDEEAFGAAQGIDDKDETGRNLAYIAFNKVEKSIIEAYDVLSDDEDKYLFYDYLLTNLKLYFDKFEEELQPDIPEPTTTEYEKEKDELEAAPVDGEDDLTSDEGGDDEELDLEL